MKFVVRWMLVVSGFKQLRTLNVFLGNGAETGQFPSAAPRTVAVSAQAEGEESPDTTGQRAL